MGDATRLSTEATRLLGQAEERARYAREPLRGDHLAEALRTVHGALAATANRRTRLMAAILPPSTLLHWRGTITEISSRLVAMAGRVRSTLLRWSPRRLLATINRSTS